MIDRRTARRARLLASMLAPWVLACTGAAFAPAGMAAAPIPAVRPMYFEHLTMREGLSQSTVMSILQDSQGYLWLATENGLDRYDGYGIREYRRTRAPQGGLASDYVWKIAEDAGGDLWLATVDGGVARWDRRTDRFQLFRHDVHDPRSLASDSVRTLLIDASQRIWVATFDRGLDVLDPRSGHARHYRARPGDARALPSDAVYALYQDRANRIWVGTEAGLVRYDPSSDAFVSPSSRGGPSRAGALRVRALEEDHTGALWIGTYGGGLARLDREGELQLFHHDSHDPGSLSNDHVWAILEDNAQRLWIATADGLDLFDRRGGRFVRYGKDAGDPQSLGDSDVMSLYQDRGGVLWVGTRHNGASHWNPQSWQLGHYRSDAFRDTEVMAFADDGLGTVWVGTKGAGLVEIDTRSGHERHFARGTGPFSLTDDRVMALLYDGNGVLWIGTMFAGLERLDLRSGTVREYHSSPADRSTLPANGIMALYEDRAGTLWVGTYGGGLASLDRQSGRFTRYAYGRDDASGLSSAAASALAEDARGNLWIGTADGGLNLLDRQSGRFYHYRRDDRDAHSLSDDAVYALHTDRHGDLWVGTAGGLDRVVEGAGTPPAVRFESFPSALGPSEGVYGIETDPEDRLWLSTNRGLIRFDPRTHSTWHFHEVHGLQGEDFTINAHHASTDGTLFFGGDNGFNAFAPEAVTLGGAPPRVVLTGAAKLNQPLPQGELPGPQRPLRLSYDDKLVSFEFAALDFTSPADNHYAYRLEGFDSGWIDAGPLHRATYTNLDPGDYVFRVRAANAAGTWNEAGLSIPVHVAPPPWATRAAKIIYGLLGLAALTILWRSQQQRRARQQRIHRLAYFDALTGLPNREWIGDFLAHSLETARARNSCVALLYVDLDQFKRINDTLGHATGDALLRHVAERLRRTLSAPDTTDELLAQGKAATPSAAVSAELARVGGDEFIIVLTGGVDLARAERTAEGIVAALARPFRQGDYELVVTPSLGIALFPEHGADVETLLKNADSAMYAAKSSGRNQFRIYSSSANARALKRLSLEMELRRALEHEQLQVYYQPKYDTRSLRIVGAEALLRWFHPQHGQIPTADFIAVAEETGLIGEIGRWTLQQACRDLTAWRAAGIGLPQLAVNISGRDFMRPDVLRWLGDTVERARLPCSLFELELTEGVLMQDAEAGRRTLLQLKDVGFAIALDDFGTGYCSLNYLKRFPLDSLKVDRAFVDDSSRDAGAAAIVRAIIVLGHNLNLQVVAEGVETHEQLRFLRAEQCDAIQGFLMSPAVAPSELVRMLGSAAASAGEPRALQAKTG